MAERKMSEVLASRVKVGHRLTTLGMLAIGAGGVALLYVWGMLLPWLIDIVYDTVKLGIGCGILALMAFVLLNKEMRTRMQYVYASFTRFLTKLFVETDRIGVLKTYAKRYHQRVDDMDAAIGDLQGKTDGLGERIDKNEAERVQELNRAKKAEEVVSKGGPGADQMRSQLALSGAQAKRLRDSNKVLRTQLAKWRETLVNLKGLREGTYVEMLNTEQTIRVQIDQSTAMDSGYKAFRAAQEALGDSAEKEMADMALESMSAEYYRKMGEIDNYLENSRSLLNGVALDKMIAVDEARAEIATMDDSKPRIPVAVRVDAGEPAETGQAATPTSTGFGDMFDIPESNDPKKARR